MKLRKPRAHRSSPEVKECIDNHEVLTYRPPDRTAPSAHEFPALVRRLLASFGSHGLLGRSSSASAACPEPEPEQIGRPALADSPAGEDQRQIEAPAAESSQPLFTQEQLAAKDVEIAEKDREIAE